MSLRLVVGLLLLVGQLGCKGGEISDQREDGCRSCHGNNRSPAPPFGLDGAEDPSAPSVGAHDAHLFGEVLGRPVACEECHLVPEQYDDPGHVDDPYPAEVTWGTLANRGMLPASWDRETLTCAGTYCHGATLTGGATTTPVWTDVSGAASDCGACHGMPPPPPHPASETCETCHGPVAGPEATLAIPYRHADGVLDVADGSSCAGCHGSAENAAPPRDLDGQSELSALTVGAHQIHLTGGRFSKKVACESCHLVPDQIDAPGHVDSSRPAEVTFDGLAVADGAFPVWDRDSASCDSVYCHGGTLDRTDPDPIWNVVDGSQAKCGSCHGLPPAAPHPQDPRCEVCHLPTAGPKLTVANRETHVDGILQVTPDDCTGCHGVGQSLAPPVDTSGRSDTALPSVGAHRTHVVGGQVSRPVPCDTCHLVPDRVDAPGHLDTPLPAELTFSGLAVAGGAKPSFDADQVTCSNLYCHGATLTGGTVLAPIWNKVDGTQGACGSCHGLPPPAPHPDNDACMLCHGPTAGPAQTIADPTTHVDGILQVTDGSCVDCHGAGDNPAPPPDVMGAVDAAASAVGAHRAHTEATGLARPVACTECHVLPMTLEDPGHVDTPLPAELTFGALASSDGAQPSFDAAERRCTNTYCHGGTLNGGALTDPAWNVVDGSPSACGSCHGLPPGGDHPQDDRCDLCHLPTAGPNQTIANPATHVDGVLQAASDCDSCHGQDGVSAPPLDLAGSLDTDERTVGAHRTHLSGGLSSKPVSCTECHVVPEALDSPGHLDTPAPAEVTFGLIAGLGAQPSWDGARCANTYCHGADGSNPSPSWTVVDGTEAPCGSCHGVPPATPVHQTNADCANCHLPTAGPNETIADRSTHVDGILQVADLDCGSCHGGMDGPAPPMDLDGDTDPTDAQVGAHQVHLTGGASSVPLVCTDCHVVPDVLDAPGHVDSPRPAEITFSGLSSALGSAPLYDAAAGSCADTYCHGDPAWGGQVPAPEWSAAGSMDCGSCHGLPPPLPHPQRGACENCHGPVAGPNLTIMDPTRHVDGIVDVDVSTCDACHGSPGNPAPPRDLDGLSDIFSVTVGAHQTHLSGGQSSRPVACEQCHLVPATLTSPGHIDSGAPAELTFGAIAAAGGAAPAFDHNTATCSDTYCHGDTDPEWNVPDGTQAACGSCHALPPPAPHPVNDRCELCHLPTAGPGITIANRDTHVDGVVQVSTTGCTGCHGTGQNLAPPVDMSGQASTDLASVGAHQAHVGATRFSQPVACDTCHLVPQDLTDPGHVDTALPAEVTFSGLATLDGATPSYDAASESCGSSYCHGGTLTGGSQTAPIWTVVDGTQAACGTCHGLPPPAPHPANQRCELCHAPTAGAGLTIADLTTHVDGVLQVTEGDCSSCHGSAQSPAPPSDLAGNTGRDQITVGAHQAHLQGSHGIANPVACNQCHGVPADTYAPGHLDTPAPAELSFGSLAVTGGAQPSFDRTQATCAGVYCHGDTLGGGTLTSPLWTSTDGSASACGSCHGVPPPAPHPQDQRCDLCHLPTAGPNQSIANPATHVDGVVQAASDCDSCHGDNGVSAPPTSLAGFNSTTELAVGAHRSHLSGGAVSKPVACDECHLVPSALDSPGHLDTALPAEVVFGSLAAFGRTPTWLAPGCSDTYCHAGTDAVNPTPTWNVVDGTEAQCGSCHGIPPNTPVHQTAADCSLCHLPTAGPNQTIANRDTHVDGVLDVTDLGCDTCHGSPGGSAPPMDTNGDLATTDLQVGAHQVHLTGGASSKAVACDTCHVVPQTVDSPGHLDGQSGAELIFGGIAAAQGATPAFDTAGRSCSDTYCHGASSGGGTNENPVWHQPGTADCGSCHGLPPPLPHPQVQACETCHAPVAGPNLTIAIPDRHVDGVEDVDVSTCYSCHGTPQSPAPPTDLAGSSDTSLLTVGAHQSHLAGGQFSRPVACETCHLVPQAVGDPGHIDSAAPAELTFTGIAGADGALPGFDGTTGSCSDVYCHGSTIDPNSTPPVWNVVNGTEAACGSCHGLPPSLPHPQNDRCEMCHLPTAGPGLQIADRSKHVDGTVQVSVTDCTGCHGSSTNLAPPVDSFGQAATTLASVGAHQTHLSGGAVSKPVACDACHLVPNDLADPGHVDTPAPAELTFGSLAFTDGANPTYNAGANSCGNTYCHGGTLAGGTHTTPDWTTVNGSEASCGSCHGLPPPAPHPADNRCVICHSPTAGPNLTIADRTTHVDGVVQASSGSCTACHGSGISPAPPNDLAGASDPSLRTVGAHRSHLEATSGLAAPVACNECHLVPTQLGDPGHVDSGPPAELTFGPDATRDGASPSFNTNQLTCSNTYCHGATLSDGFNKTPQWNVVDGTQATCGACHGVPPTGNHPNDNRCDLCHLPTAGPNQSIANPATHIDGVVQAAATCDSCHGENGVAAPPLDLNGLSATTELTVGAHRTHLAGGQVSRPVACNECHVVPTQLDSPGHLDTPPPAELTFGPLASQQSSPAWNAPTCANTYCHDGVDAATPSPTWNVVDGTQADCGGCHGIPPNTPVHQSASDCTNCHLPTAGPSQTIANRDTHVDGVLQVAQLDCGSCHGGPSSAAPPPDLDGQSSPSDPQVGAHQAHLSGGASSAPVACNTCHVVPSALDDPGHVDSPRPAELFFSGLASLGASAPSYDGGASTCTNTYCHGATMAGGTNPDPTWNQPASAPCGSCHGLPPPAPHPQVQECETCHAPVAGPNQTIADPSRHVDGVEDVTSPTTCESCHGSAQSPAPPADLSGSATSPQVGAHQVHLLGSGNARPVPCSECHLEVSPTNIDQAGHYDTPRPAEVLFGALGRTDGASPTKSGLTCSNTYCHGTTLPGGTTPNPSWDGPSLGCTGCHGMPPPDANHGNGTATQCESCHPDTAGPNQTIADPSKHVDGNVDTSATCDACHGQNGDPTPPLDLAGLSVSPQVGAHQAHRSPANSSPVACATCHLVPNQYADAGHADTPPPAEVTLIGRAALDGASPSYTSNQLRCSNTYCHGATNAGGSTAVFWDDTDGSESQCGACHGMPPATPAHSAVSGPNTCDLCHEQTAGPNQTIIDPSLHLDGVVEVSGGGCDACHGAPPTPGNESYPGSGGAHLTHAGDLQMECATCHGNNGDGPSHNQGQGVVQRNNVDIVFDSTFSYPGGTTMDNGQGASYSTNSMSCAVGCHNPVPGNPDETPNLGNSVGWNASPPGCNGCHDSVATTAPRSHDISGLGDSGCLECHDQSSHTGGTPAFVDPDPADSFAYGPGNIDGLCRTCHDGGGGSFFGNQGAPDVSPYWTASSHGAQGYPCSTCHTYHGSTNNGPLFMDRSPASCMASGCHANLSTDFNQVPGGPISHHRIEGGSGIQLNCIDCHNPHLSQPHPLAAVDPDNKWQIYALPDEATTQRTSQGDYRPFCLKCHDGSPPPGVSGALNIAQALNNGPEVTMFRKGGDSMHEEHRRYNCLNCHEDHGSPGTPGINRGRLLRSYMTINDFSQNNGYSGKNSCSTPRPVPGFGFGCH